jgi:regulator of sigma E protease
MLDGGHLFYYIIEFVNGSHVSESAQEIGMRIGIAMVGSLMLLAFYNDIMRLM